jgi:hypothetical protein
MMVLFEFWAGLLMVIPPATFQYFEVLGEVSLIPSLLIVF